MPEVDPPQVNPNDLPWSEAPPPPQSSGEDEQPTEATETTDEGTEVDERTPEQLPWGERPAPQSHVPRPIIPPLRFRYGAQLWWMTEADFTASGRIGIELATQRLQFVPQVRDIISLHPRIETSIGPEFQTLTGGLAFHLLPPDLFSLCITIMGGMAHTDEGYHGALTSDFGIQARMPIRSILFLLSISYTRSWLSPIEGNAITFETIFRF